MRLKEGMFLSERMVCSVMVVLFAAAVMLLLVMLHTMRCQMARIYNWDGKKYCYLGYASIGKNRGCREIHISERMVDLSHTTRYQIVFGKKYFQKNRYREVFVCAGEQKNYLVIDKQVLKTEIPF